MSHEITAYATADGYSQSETITAKLYWVDGSLEATNMSNVRAASRGILIQKDDEFITISGLNNDETVSMYEIGGKKIGSAKAVNGIAILNINKKGNIVVVKVGNDAIKVEL